jgi:ribosomal protein S18 acetylase RimI-like enzyme
MPIACSAAYVQNGRLYVALVATVPEMQGRGYGEAVTRLSVVAAAKESGHTRSVLHATCAGIPLYRRLGYEPTASFTAYEPDH